MHRVLVRGANDVGSAVAQRLFRAGFAVAIHEQPHPTTSRRTMAFTDALFDGEASLEGVRAVRLDEPQQLKSAFETRAAVIVITQDFTNVLSVMRPDVLIDARMRKRARPESQLGLAPLTIGLGPNFAAGETTDLVVETAWGEDLGRVFNRGTTKPLEGEPQELGGHARERFVYAPAGGLFQSSHRIGDLLAEGDEIAEIDGTPIRAPLAGMLRALTRDGVPVSERTKVIEIDARGAEAPSPCGIGRRPGRIADGILAAVQQWRSDRAGAVRVSAGRAQGTSPTGGETGR